MSWKISDAKPLVNQLLAQHGTNRVAIVAVHLENGKIIKQRRHMGKVLKHIAKIIQIRKKRRLNANITTTPIKVTLHIGRKKCHLIGATI